MNNLLPLTVARKNLSELVNQAFYENKVFGIAKGKRPMGALIGARQWKKIIETLEKYDQGLADTLAIMADPDLQEFLEKGEEDMGKGKVFSWEKVLSGINN